MNIAFNSLWGVRACYIDTSENKKINHMKIDSRTAKEKFAAGPDVPSPAASASRGFQ